MNKKELYRKYIERNTAFVRAYKLASGCVDCGYNEHYAALDFDHIPGRGRKEHNMNQTATKSHSLETIAREIEKCEVVCANCHRVRTAQRRAGEL